MPPAAAHNGVARKFAARAASDAVKSLRIILPSGVAATPITSAANSDDASPTAVRTTGHAKAAAMVPARSRSATAAATKYRYGYG